MYTKDPLISQLRSRVDAIWALMLTERTDNAIMLMCIIAVSIDYQTKAAGNDGVLSSLILNKK